MKEAKVITLGMDFKITPDDRVALIEVNGQRSGFEGFTKLESERGFLLERSKIKSELAAVYSAELLEMLADGTCVNAQEFCLQDAARILNAGIPQGDSLQNRVNDACEDVAVNRRIEAKLQDVMDDLFFDFPALNADRGVVRQILSERMPYAFPGVKKRHNGDAKKQMFGNKLLAQELRHYFGVDTFAMDRELGLIVVLHFPKGVEIRTLYPGFNEEKSKQQAAMKKEFLQRVFELFPVNPRMALLSLSESNFLISPMHKKFFVEDVLFYPHNPDYVETVVEDKLEQKYYVDNAHAAPCIIWKGDMRYVKNFANSLRKNPHPLIDVEKHPYFVIKPREGERGERIKICGMDDMRSIEAALADAKPDTFLIEAFVPSKQLMLDGMVRDGSMRYFMDVLCETDGVRNNVRAVFEKAYFRVSPVDMRRKDLGLNEKFRVNLCKGAVPMPCSAVDFQRVQSVARQVAKRIINQQKVWK